jgi:hypothetical protein
MNIPPAVTFEQALATDAEALVQLRIAAMRESLEHLARFDPVRARERFLVDIRERMGYLLFASR